MDGPAQRGSRGRGRSPRHASSARLVAAASTVGTGSAATTARPSPAPTPAPDETAGLETRSTYRLLVSRGLTPDEAATLTAFMCGIPIADVRWSIRQVNQLLFLTSHGSHRTLRRLGRRRSPTALIRIHPDREGETLLPPERSTNAEAAPYLLPAPLRRVWHGGLGTIRRCVPVITFLTDFGPSAPAVCRGVMFRICPDANIIDITHQVPRYSIRERRRVAGVRPAAHAGRHPRRGRRPGRRHGAAGGRPRVGTRRRADRAGQRAAHRRPPEALGGIVEARSLENRDLMLAGHLVQLPRPRHLRADGRATSRPACPSSRSGRPVDVERARPAARASGRRSRDGRARDLDRPRPDLRQRHASPATPADLEAAHRTARAGRPLVIEFPAHDGATAVEERTVWERTFGRVPVGSSLLMADSEGHLSLADNQGDAARPPRPRPGPAGPDPRRPDAPDARGVTETARRRSSRSRA